MHPKKFNTTFLKKFMIIFGPLSSCFDFATFGFLWVTLHATEGMFQTGWISGVHRHKRSLSTLSEPATNFGRERGRVRRFFEHVWRCCSRPGYCPIPAWAIGLVLWGLEHTRLLSLRVLLSYCLLAQSSPLKNSFIGDMEECGRKIKH